MSNLVILKVGHAFIKGKFANDKPKKDSLWGLMRTDEAVIKFFGRRGGSIRFKQEPISELEAALKLYQQKLDGTDAKKLKHDDLDADKQAELLGTNFSQELCEKYEAALAEGKIDYRIAKVDDEADGEVAEPKAEDPKAAGKAKGKPKAESKAPETPPAQTAPTNTAPFSWPYPTTTIPSSTQE